MSQLPEIHLNTVGRIGSGIYAGWFVLVIPNSAPGFNDSYTIYVCSDSTFAFEPDTRECFDEWVQNNPSLEGVFEEKYMDVTWQPEIATPNVSAATPRASSLAARLRERHGSQSSTQDDIAE